MDGNLAGKIPSFLRSSHPTRAGPGMSETTAESVTSGPFSTLAKKANLPRFSRAEPLAATRRVREGWRTVPRGTSRGGITVRAAPESGNAIISKTLPRIEQARRILSREPDLRVTVFTRVFTRVLERLRASLPT